MVSISVKMAQELIHISAVVNGHSTYWYELVISILHAKDML